MGIKSATKFLVQAASGVYQQVFALKTSAGAPDAGAIPALNDAGVLDKSILGAVDASAGAADAAKPVLLGANGRLSSTMMPSGLGADTKSYMASEAIGAGKFVNIWNDAGTWKARLADNTAVGKRAHGFAPEAIANGNTGVVQFEGANNAVTGVADTDVFLGTAGGFIGPSGLAALADGAIIQALGTGTSATEINVEFDVPTIVAKA